MRIELSKHKRISIKKNPHIKRFRFNFVDRGYIFINIPFIKVMIHYYDTNYKPPTF